MRVFLEIEEGANFCRIHVKAEEANDLRSEYAAFNAAEVRRETMAEHGWDNEW